MTAAAAPSGPCASGPRMPRQSRLLALVWLAVAILGVHHTSGKWINTYAGPFIASMGPRWNPCPQGRSENLMRFNVKVSQFRNQAVEIQKNLQRLTGNVTLDTPLNNTLWAYIKGATRSNNQWKENAIVMNFPGGACKSTMDNFPDFFKKVWHQTASTHKGPCNVPKGAYVVEDEPVNWTIPKLNVFPYGMYRIEVGFNLGPASSPRNLMCLITDIVLHPAL